MFSLFGWVIVRRSEIEARSDAFNARNDEIKELRSRVDYLMRENDWYKSITMRLSETLNKFGLQTTWFGGSYRG